MPDDHEATFACLPQESLQIFQHLLVNILITDANYDDVRVGVVVHLLHIRKAFQRAKEADQPTMWTLEVSPTVLNVSNRHDFFKSFYRLDHSYFERHFTIIHQDVLN